MTSYEQFKQEGHDEIAALGANPALRDASRSWIN